MTILWQDVVAACEIVNCNGVEVQCQVSPFTSVIILCWMWNDECWLWKFFKADFFNWYTQLLHVDLDVQVTRVEWSSCSLLCCNIIMV